MGHGETNPRPARSIGTLLVCIAIALSACGDGDDATDGTTLATTAGPSTTMATGNPPAAGVATTTDAAGADNPSTTSAMTTTATTESSSSEPAVCDPFLEVSAAFSGPPDPTTIGGLLDDIEANAPDEIADELAILTINSRTVLDTGDFGAFETPEFEAAIATSETWMAENCDFATQTEIIAVDYRYEGQAPKYPAGRAVFTVVNEGAEVHELLLLRKNDGVDLSLEELMALPEAEAETMTTYVGAVFVGPPGARGNLIVDLTPGDYIAVCNIPAGTTVAEDGSFNEGTGEPHVMLGMSFEFTVA